MAVVIMAIGDDDAHLVFISARRPLLRIAFTSSLGSPHRRRPSHRVGERLVRRAVERSPERLESPSVVAPALTFIAPLLVPPLRGAAICRAWGSPLVERFTVHEGEVLLRMHVRRIVPIDLHAGRRLRRRDLCFRRLVLRVHARALRRGRHLRYRAFSYHHPPNSLREAFHGGAAAAARWRGPHRCAQLSKTYRPRLRRGEQHRRLGDRRRGAYRQLGERLKVLRAADLRACRPRALDGRPRHVDGNADRRPRDGCLRRGVRARTQTRLLHARAFGWRHRDTDAGRSSGRCSSGSCCRVCCRRRLIPIRRRASAHQLSKRRRRAAWRGRQPWRAPWMRLPMEPLALFAALPFVLGFSWCYFLFIVIHS